MAEMTESLDWELEATILNNMPRALEGQGKQHVGTGASHIRRRQKF